MTGKFAFSFIFFKYSSFLGLMRAVPAMAGCDDEYYLLLGYSLFPPLGGRRHSMPRKEKKEGQVREQRKRKGSRHGRQNLLPEPGQFTRSRGMKNRREYRRKKKHRESSNPTTLGHQRKNWLRSNTVDSTSTNKTRLSPLTTSQSNQLPCI